jgi:hypothetical protein
MDASSGLLSTGILGTALAALGYAAKEIWALAKLTVEERRQRRARLIQLQSLLYAARASYLIQVKHRERLFESIKQSCAAILPNPSEEYPFDEIFSRAFPKLDAQQRQLHSIIRGITIHSLRPLNESTLQWLREDTYFRAATGRLARLASRLSDLENHLLLWMAKYKVWMEDESRTLVYMADENEHGLGFPTGIEQLVEEALCIESTVPFVWGRSTAMAAKKKV